MVRSPLPFDCRDSLRVTYQTPPHVPVKKPDNNFLQENLPATLGPQLTTWFDPQKKEEPTSPGRPRSGPKRTPRHFQRAFARALAGRVGAHRGDGVALRWGGGLPTQMPPRLCYLFEFVICWNQKNIILSLGILFGRTRKTLLRGKVFVNPTCDLRNNHENLVTIFWNFCSFEMLFLCSWQKSLKYLDFYIENVCPVVSLCKTRKILSGMCKNEGG